MAIATVKKILIAVPRFEQQRLLHLLQSFQKIELAPSKEAEDIGFFTGHSETHSWSEVLARIGAAQKILGQWGSGSALSKLKDGRPLMSLSALEDKISAASWEAICTQAFDLTHRLEALRARRGELLSLTEKWAPWRALSISPSAASTGFKYTCALAGSMEAALYPAFCAEYGELSSNRGYCHKLFQSGDRVGVFLLYPKEDHPHIMALCRQSSFARLDFEYDALPHAMLDAWKSEEAGLVAEEKELIGRLEQLSKEQEALNLAEEFYETLTLRSDAQQQTLHSASTVLVSGWMAAEDLADLEGLLRSSWGGLYYLSVSDMRREELGQTPTILKNNRLVSAFETLTEMYSMPAYDEVDPTPVMTPFYLVFFGMMVADIGYGLVLLLATLGAKLFFKPDRPMQKSIDFFFYLSFPTMAWGAVYGSLFGTSLPFALLSPTTDIIPILILSLVFGWMQLMTGLMLNVYISLKKRQILQALSGGVSWMLLLAGLAALVLAKTVIVSQGLFLFALALCILAVIGIVALPVVESKGHRVKGLLKGLYALYGATGYIGDLVSYTRLMALGIAGGSIAIAFNTIIASLPLAMRLTAGLVLAIILHAINLFLSLLGAYVHGIRLQYVEFFGKFYGGGGRKFSPFKAAEKHIYLVEEMNNTNNKVEESL